MARVTIVIPVYGKPELFERALGSVIEHGNIEKNKLIVVNDCGPSSQLISEIARTAMLVFPNIEYYENDTNLGFVSTCNRAVFELDNTANDVLLLNSDAELTAHALEEMQSVLALSSRHACVAPRTNEGTIATVPFYSKRQKSREELFQLFHEQKSFLPRYSITPVSPGFCILIRRELIREHGLFDNVFSPGYEEENDFCMRVNALGFSAVLANHAFVFHEAGQSFGGRREKLAQHHSQLLNRRFPFFPQLVENYITAKVDPVDKFFDYLRPESNPSILLDCSALSQIHNGTSKNILSFLDFLSSTAKSEFSHCSFTLLVHRTVADHYHLKNFGFKISFVEEEIHELFDLGFALSPIWAVSSLERLVNYCSRFAVLHLDIIAIRTSELSSVDFGRESAAYSAAHWADLTIFISNSARNDFLEFRPSALIRQERVIHQGVIAPWSFPVSIKQKRAKLPHFDRSKGPSVLIVGNAFKHKQVERAIESIKTEPLDVIALSKRTGTVGNVQTIRSGDLPDEYLDELFSQADVVVFPSAYEGFGLPIAESLRAKKPLIVFDTETAREVVHALGGEQSTLFFRDFSLLTELITTAVGHTVGSLTQPLRSSDDFNADVLSELLSLCQQKVDPDFLRQRSFFFREVARNHSTQVVAVQLSRRSVRWSSKIADILWGPIYFRLSRK